MWRVGARLELLRSSIELLDNIVMMSVRERYWGGRDCGDVCCVIIVMRWAKYYYTQYTGIPGSFLYSITTLSDYLQQTQFICKTPFKGIIWEKTCQEWTTEIYFSDKPPESKWRRCDRWSMFIVLSNCLEWAWLCLSGRYRGPRWCRDSRPT